MKKTTSDRLSNKDLLPLEDGERTWKAVNFASIWMGCIHNIPTYATVGGLIAIGLSPWQVLAIIVTASLILFAALALNGHAGTKYGLPFPVIIRASYGIYGANIPALLRAFTAIMWLGIQTFAGSTALHILLLNIWPGWGESRRRLEYTRASSAGFSVVHFLLGHSSACTAARHGINQKI